MDSYVLFFHQIDRSSLPYVGGKGANLGEMTKAGFPVPGGFCITTAAYQDFIASSRQMATLFQELSALDVADFQQLRELGRRIRTHIQQIAIPARIEDEIIRAWHEQGPDTAYAIRSSATAEDLPTASFAGQQDTYLNIKGQAELLEHVRQCWASLFTDRAIVYRAKNGFKHQEVYLSIVVQQMIFPDISGIMFTADPVSGNRTVVSIDASFGLGEALVSGLVSADLYKVKNGGIIHKQVSQKKIAVYSKPEGGTVTEDLPASLQQQQALPDQQIIELALLGKRIESHYKAPQDIEFCLANNKFYIVQSRPITTLYPVPDIAAEPLRVLISFGHIQMMTDAIRPLGLSVLRTIFPAALFFEAGGRIFIDLTDVLHSTIARRLIPKLLANADEGISRAMEAVARRPEFLAGRQANSMTSVRKVVAPIIKKVWHNLRTADPEMAGQIVDGFLREKVMETKQSLHKVEGAERITVVKQQLRPILFPYIINNFVAYVAPGIIANLLLYKILGRTFGSTAELGKLNMSLPGNVTSEMGLRLGDLADVLRDLPDVQSYLKTADDQTFFSRLADVAGGERFKQQFEKFIDDYGMRCPGEIDLTSTRWYEAPTQLQSALFSHMQSVGQGEHRQRFSDGEKKARSAAQRILQAVKPNYFKTKLVNRLINVFRHTGGLREHHKYLLVTVMGECKKAIMAEARALVEAGILSEAEDVYFLNLEELVQLLQNDSKEDVSDKIAERKAQYQRYRKLKPPRVMTSEGEIVVIPPDRGNAPEGALTGSPVSAGVAEGRARVILRPEQAFLHAGEILVAPQTDPGWTPLFQSAVAIVTEVGGLMTHGAVVAREYGIPAVVGVDGATTLIKDGEKIRVDGDLGFIEKLE